MSVNRCFFTGHTGKDPEVRTVADKKVATFSIAVTERAYKTKDGKEVPEKTMWVNIVAWNGLANLAESWIKKGSLIHVEGRLSMRNYEKDGVTRYATEIIAEGIELLGGKPESKPPKVEPKEQYASAPQEEDSLPF